MTKNALIAKLQKIEGNPEIKVWNGAVGDWMNFQLQEDYEFVKETEEFTRFSVEAKWKIDNNTDVIPEDVQIILDEKIKRKVRSLEWDFPNRYVSPEDFEKWYGKKRKKILFIEPLPRGKEEYDRWGKISY